jgi:hypothetical protein
MRQASTAMAKESAGLSGRHHAEGDSPFRPNMNLQEVGLLGFRGHARGRARSLNVDNDEREFSNNSQIERLGF